MKPYFEAEIGAWKKSKKISLEAKNMEDALEEANERLCEAKDIFLDCKAYVVKILCNKEVVWRFDLHEKV